MLNDAYNNNIKYVFVATECKKIQETVLDDGEYTEVILKSREEFREGLRTNFMSDTGSAYIALDYLGWL